jgi:hypothetical protein
MSAALNKYKQNYLKGVADGPFNANPCLRCLQNVTETTNLKQICQVHTSKVPANVTFKCLGHKGGCQENKNADCMQVCEPVPIWVNLS